MDERFADVGRGITLCYEELGDPAGEPLLLVMGLGTQMLGWHEDFCAQLGERGFHVVRFDNRDVGRSTHVDGRPPTLRQLVTRSPRGAHYRLDDMADDCAGLMDHLGWSSAHVAGASMGGMIAQTLAARHPDRVRSLASIMSNTGSRLNGQPALSAYSVLLGKRPKERAEYVDRIEAIFAQVGSPGFERDTERTRTTAGLSFDRAQDSGQGMGRQMGAVLASGSRARKILPRISVPTVVVHGTKDRLVRPSGGKATARAIPGSHLVLVDGMGHDLPRGAWPQVLHAIEQNTRRATATRAAAA